MYIYIYLHIYIYIYTCIQTCCCLQHSPFCRAGGPNVGSVAGHLDLDPTGDGNTEHLEISCDFMRFL